MLGLVEGMEAAWPCGRHPSGLEAPSMSVPIARDIIPPILLCTTHVTRFNSQQPVNNSPCLRYTTLEPHHGRTANEKLRIKPPGALKTGPLLLLSSPTPRAHA